jgi:transposase
VIVRCVWFASIVPITGPNGRRSGRSRRNGIGSAETLRKWVRQAEVDAGARPGVSSEESAELKRLRRENAELKRANEILKAASAFFAAELDRPHMRS